MKTCPDCSKVNEGRAIMLPSGIYWECSECGTIHAIAPKYRYVDEKRAEDIMSLGYPKGFFLLDTGIELIGIDSRGDQVITEEFPDREEFVDWVYERADSDIEIVRAKE